MIGPQRRFERATTGRLAAWAGILVLAATPITAQLRGSASTRMAAANNLAAREQQASPPQADIQAEAVTAGPRELLDLLNISESQLQFFDDGRPISGDNWNTLARILYRLPRFPLAKLHQWQQWEPDWPQLVDTPEEYRGAVLAVAGRARLVQTASLPEALAKRFDLPDCYRVLVTTEGLPYTFIVYTREIPDDWFVKAPALAVGQAIPWDEPVGLSGLFLQTGEVIDGHPSLVVATNRLAWYPQREDAATGITADKAFLARQGLDYDLFADVTDHTDLSHADREGFYQILDVVESIPDARWKNASAVTPDVATLLQQPDALRGRLVQIRGTARRALEIKVTDEDIRTRYGWDHYYELEVFVDSDVVIHWVTEPDRSGRQETKSFTRYPCVVCVRELPPEMPTGEWIDEPVSVTAVYLKLWAYPTRFMAERENADGNSAALQTSPLILGKRVQWQPATSNASQAGGRWVLGWFVGLLVLLGGLVWYFRREDQRFQARGGRHRADPPGFPS